MALVNVQQMGQLGDKVDLYILDMSPLGVNTQLYFTPSMSANCRFNGQDYAFFGIEVTGFSRSSQEQLAEPTMTIGNVDQAGIQLAATYEDLIGAKMTRLRTLARFLQLNPDGTPNSGHDPSATTIPEIWYVEQKLNANRLMMQWKLKASTDIDGIMIPRRLVTKNTCGRTYRVWDGTQFRYATNRACPYAGAAKYKLDGTATSDPVKDQCSQNIAGCKARFGNDPLPAWVFPGVSRIPGS